MPVLKRFPVLKTMSAYLMINALADFNEQVLIKKRTRETYKYDKTARITLVGTFVVSPIVFSWMKLAEKLLPGRGFKVVLTKVLLDQLLAAPVEISAFYICTNILEGKTDILEELRQKFWKTWTTGLLFWPAAQCMNFSLIPPAYRTSRFMPLCSLTWTTYLCYMKELQMKKEPSTATNEQPLSLSTAEEGMRLSPINAETTERIFGFDSHVHPIPFSHPVSARVQPVPVSQVVSKMAVNVESHLHETSLDTAESHTDFQCLEFHRKLASKETDICDTLTLNSDQNELGETCCHREYSYGNLQLKADFYILQKQDAAKITSQEHKLNGQTGEVGLSYQKSPQDRKSGENDLINDNNVNFSKIKGVNSSEHLSLVSNELLENFKDVDETNILHAQFLA